MLKGSLPALHAARLSFFPLISLHSYALPDPHFEDSFAYLDLNQNLLGFGGCPVSLAEVISVPLGHVALKGELHNGLFFCPQANKMDRR